MQRLFSFPSKTKGYLIIPFQASKREYSRKDEDSLRFCPEDISGGKQMISRLLFLFKRRPYALEIVQEIELYLFNESFTKVCNSSEIVAVKYALFALHIWIVKNRLNQEFGLESWRIMRSIDNLFEDYTKDVVYQFQDYFDKDVYAELSRIKRTLYYSLDDLFEFQNQERSLEDIVIDEVFLGTVEEEEQVKQLGSYIKKRMDYLKYFTPSQLKNNKICWDLISKK